MIEDWEQDKQVVGQGGEEKDTRKKGPMLEPAAAGAQAWRPVFVSPHKKLLAKVAAKQGDKGIKKAPQRQGIQQCKGLNKLYFL
ncbi:hypothetical protein Bca52824_096296 [Brassica carinata]|uniref:Uncharacterized protein n=1 Tax=Brassica carinata TaxID=52824 RepID=A0A8X7THG6_BRACI|nr:hypothetical protein Bca52824_096296 [Brassica carinata]